MHTCAVESDVAIICWGHNAEGQAPTISLTPDLPASMEYGDSLSQAFSASGGPRGEPYTFAVVNGVLPPGLALSSDGLLSGTATQAGSYSFTVRALDAIRYMGTRAYTMEVTPAPLMVKADDLSRLFGQPNPPLTCTVSGFKNGEGAEVLSGPPPLLDTTAATNSPPGTYPILIGGSLAADNYAITYAPGTLTIMGLRLYLPTVLH